MVDKGFWIFHFGNWDFEKNTGGNFTYTFNGIKNEGGLITSTTGLTLDLNTGNATYKGQVPYCIIRSDGVTENKTYLNESSNFCVVILFDESQMIVIDKRFENSLYTKLALEGVNTTNFKSIYRNNSTIVWQSV